MISRHKIIGMIITFSERWNAFFFHELKWPTPDVLRIGYSLLMLVNFLILGLDLEMFFFENGVMPFEVSRTLIESDTWTLFSLLPKSDLTIYAAYGLCLFHLSCLLIGWKCRLNAVGVFIWLVSFQHRHIILFDGEDILFRLLGFLLIFMPIGRRWAIDAKNKNAGLGSGWALRLFQIQMSLLYFSTALLKFHGEDWPKGYALHYISRLDDLYGRFPVPQFLFDVDGLGRWTTWSVVALEFLLPIALWTKKLRPYAICAGILFHLGIDYAMNLFLFQWLMILGLISFVGPEEWKWFKNKLPGKLQPGHS